MTRVAPVQITRASLFSTHHASAQDLLAGRERPFTAPTFGLLTGRARRFTSLATQMHIEVCGVLQPDSTDFPLAVFATCHGEIQTAEKLIADFHSNAMMSSARFAMSVHNTPSGVYSVAKASTAATTTITGDNAVAAGWLEAVLAALEAGKPVLLSIADEPVPDVFEGPPCAVGIAAGFVLSPAAVTGTTGRQVELAIRMTDEPVPETLQALALAVDAATRDDAATVVLGRIQPGAVLELHFSGAAA